MEREGETVAEGNDDPVEGDWDATVKETASVGLTVEGPDKDRDAEHKEKGVNAKRKELDRSPVHLLPLASVSPRLGAGWLDEWLRAEGVHKDARSGRTAWVFGVLRRVLVVAQSEGRRFVVLC